MAKVVAALSRIAAVALILVAHPSGAGAADKLRVGKSIGPAFTYIPLDIGLAQGFFHNRGLAVEEFDFGGAAKQEQALIADSVDIGLGSSTLMAHLVKGSPLTAVAVIVTSTANLGIVIAYDSPIKSIDDLKGKLIGITTPGSLTDWLVRELVRAKNWGPDGVKPVAIGSSRAGNIAALKVHSVDAIIDDIGLAFSLGSTRETRLLAPVSEFARNFVRECIFATNKIVKDDPDAVRRFIQAWFESVAYMKTHKAESIAIGSKVQGISEADDARMYDIAVSMFSDNGRFEPNGLAVLSRSFVDMNLLPEESDLSKVYTETLLP